MKLSVQTTRTITTDDMRIFCEPPLTFEGIGYFSPSFVNDLAEWEKNPDDDRAIKFVSRIFLSVSQNGARYPLSTEADVLALRDAIEEINPGNGNNFLATIVEEYTRAHYRFFRNKFADLENSSQE